MKWAVQTLKDGKTTLQIFDKIVLATGINKLPLVPKIDGLDDFKGEIVHSAGYKRSDTFILLTCKNEHGLTELYRMKYRPSSLKDKTVLIVGLSNSAVDTATTLVGHAKHVYISRRHDAFVVSVYYESSKLSAS